MKVRRSVRVVTIILVLLTRGKGAVNAPITLCNSNYAVLIFDELVDLVYYNRCREEILQDVIK